MMMANMGERVPEVFEKLAALGCVEKKEINNTEDGFFAVFKSVSDILSMKDIKNFPGSDDTILECDRFFDDWYLYAVPFENTFVYGLFKLREQEEDANEDKPADGDTPGVTVSFIAFDTSYLLKCLENASAENRKKLGIEINRVVAYRKQRHHKAMRKYFMNPGAEASYLIADLYVKHIASFVHNGYVFVSKHYREIYRESAANKKSKKLARIPSFIESVNRAAGYTVCDHEKIYVKDCKKLSGFEKNVILATHTGNVSVYSFAAEVEYHARFLFPLAKMKIPFLGKSIYESAIRADMTIDDAEMEGTAPFYREDSVLVKRQINCHCKKEEIHI